MNVALNRVRTAAETDIIEGFRALEDTLPGGPSVHDDRRRRMALFEREGLPHRRIEAFKYTDLRSFMRELPPLADAPDESVEADGVDVPLPLLENAHQIVMVDGFVISGTENLPVGVKVIPFADALDSGAIKLSGDDHPSSAVEAFNAAFARDGFALTFEGTVETPLELVFQRSSAATQSHARVAVALSEDARAKIIERHISPDGVEAQSTVATRYTAGKGAKLDAMRIQKDGDAAYHLGEIALDIGEDAEVKLLHIVSGARMMRCETRARFVGENARFDVAGISMTADRQHADLTLYVDHLVPNCESTETFKSVIDDHAKAIFQGKIVVAPDAQKTDAQMAVDSLLLSDRADMIAKPELEIFADDVSCAHGATCGDIDEELMFYLLARGVPPEGARKLLLQAFLSEGAELFEDHAFEDIAFAEVEAWLSADVARS
ncbi:MAG: Fe-S cluster assembly protein SufD [Pseudomonadota bacterium]